MGEFFGFPTVIGLVFALGVVLACALGYVTAQVWKLRSMVYEIGVELSAQGKQAATSVTFADAQPSLPDVGQTLVALGKTLDMLNIAANENSRYARAATTGYINASGNYEQLSKDLGLLSVAINDVRKEQFRVQNAAASYNLYQRVGELTERITLLVNKVVEVKNEVDMANQRLTYLAEALLPPMPATIPEPHVVIEQTKPDVIADSFEKAPKQRKQKEKDTGQIL